jgi:hypothetical protein
MKLFVRSVFVLVGIHYKCDVGEDLLEKLTPILIRIFKY